MCKAKVHLELNQTKEVKDNKKGFFKYVSRTKERLRNLGLFSLEKKVEKGSHCYLRYLKCRSQMDGATLFSVVCSDKTRQQAETTKQEVPHKYKEELLYCEGDRALEQPPK